MAVDIKPDDFYTNLEYGLKKWMWDNPTIMNNLPSGNVKKFFRLTLQEGLVVDISLFNDDFINKHYMRKFMVNAEKFIHRLCLVMKDCAARNDIFEFSITVTVVKHVYKCSRRVKIHRGFL